jgi:pilus assembly protein TadC
MIAWLLGLAGAWSVLRWFGVDRRWPWRVADLAPPSGGTAGPPRGVRVARSAPWGPARTWHGVRDRRRRARAVTADLVVTVDLLHVAVSAGHTLHTALVEVGRSGSGPVAAGLARVDASFARGHTLIDALGELPDELGPAVRPLATTLVASLRSGAPLGPALQRLADAERRRERRRAEERVRRLPVTLLAPLVGLVLPAFVVLTIVPVAWTTARAGLMPASA